MFSMNGGASWHSSHALMHAEADIVRVVVAPPPEETDRRNAVARSHYDLALRGDLPVPYPALAPCQFCGPFTDCAACSDSMRSHGLGEEGGCLACWQRQESAGVQYEQRSPHRFECPHP